MSKTYDANSIDVLTDIEHLRLRPAMYIGAVDETGVKHILKEVVDNSIDEYLDGQCTEISVTIDTKAHTFLICDNGRGIPIEKNDKSGISTLTTVLTRLKSGGKFGKQAYATSVGLHGIGVKATNILSEWLSVTTWRSGKAYTQTFERGEPTSEVTADKERNSERKHGTEISFKPDTEIFGKAKVDVESVRVWLKQVAYINSGLTITLMIDGAEEVYASSGLGQLVTDYSTADELELLHDPIVFTSKDGTVDVALGWASLGGDSSGEQWWSFVNSSLTPEGGTHAQGVIKAITKILGVRAKDALKPEDLRDGLYATVHVKVSEPQFKSQTKDKLLNSDIVDKVCDELAPFLKTFFDSNPKIAGMIVERAVELQRVRDSVRKMRNAINKISVSKGARGVLPGKLHAAPFATKDNRELFIVEGDSAGGSAKNARDANYQEVLPLRGKIPNAANWDLPKLLANNEITSMMTAIGASITAVQENDLSNIRVHRVCLLMDADPDGQHITSLVLTFFSTWLWDLIKEGYVYVVDAPLFRGIYKGDIYYSHTLKDLETAAGVDSSKMEVSRLKGHGEADPSELKHYAMDPKTRRLWKVNYGKNDYELILELMGPNSSERKVLLGVG